MRFAEFQALRAELRATRPGLRDHAETNVYAALADLIPPPPDAAPTRVHRCHLAQDWAAHFGLAAEAAPRALVCSGVRHGLALLFRHYAAQGAQLWLPADNYPVYRELADAAGLASRTFTTLDGPHWPDGPPGRARELLLVTNPLKPLGRPLADAEADQLDGWLGADERRRLLIDAVYDLDAGLQPTTRRLLANGRTILLHSLTKGWLQPRLFGVALVPAADREALTPAFRDAPPAQDQLRRAAQLLNEHGEMPKRVATRIAAGRGRTAAALAGELDLGDPSKRHGYFLPCRGSWRALLDRHGVLGLPARIFGSERDDLTILSSLGATG